MQQAIMHPWIRDVIVPRTIAPTSVPSFTGPNSNQFREVPQIQTNSSFESSSIDRYQSSATTPITPGLLPRPLETIDNCSQEFQALALQTNGGITPTNATYPPRSAPVVMSTDSVTYEPSLSEFPSVPNMPYPLQRSASSVQDESPLQINPLESAWSISKIGVAPKIVDESMNGLAAHDTVRPTNSPIVTRGKRKVRPESQPPSSSPPGSPPPSSPRSIFDHDDDNDDDNMRGGELLDDEVINASAFGMSIDKPTSSGGSRSATGEPVTPTKLRSRKSFPTEGQNGPPVMSEPLIKPIKATRPPPAPPSTNLRPKRSAVPTTARERKIEEMKPDAKRRKVSAGEESTTAPARGRFTKRPLAAAAAANEPLNPTKVLRVTRSSVAAGGPQRR